MHNRGATLLAAIVWMLCVPVSGSAEEAAVEGFSNYYRREGNFDWATNCRVAARLPAAGTQLPVGVSLQFLFEHDQERLSVFQTYSRGTHFDLGVVSGSTFTYVETRRAPTVSGRQATVSFAQPLQLDASPGGTTLLQFEMYGDCNACSTAEALPPDRDHTTWRIHGGIEVVADASRRVVSCRFVNVGSEEPDKQLPSRDPAYYPERKLRRPYISFKVSGCGPLANPQQATSNPSCPQPCACPCPSTCVPSCCVRRSPCCQRRACARRPTQVVRSRCYRRSEDD